MSSAWLLDTSVVSGLLRPKPEARVFEWVALHPLDALYVSAVTQAEMLYGARLLPAGKRRRELEGALRAIFSQDFAGRVLPFDTLAAPVYADIVAGRRRLGRPISQFDAQIASIARTHGTALVTRNTVDFADCGLTLIDPWTAAD